MPKYPTFIKAIKNLSLVGLCLLFFNAATNAQYIGYRLDNNKKKVSIPFEIHNNLIVLPVTIDGMIQLNFILDTGVRSSILFEKAITDALGAFYARKITILGAGQEKLVEALVATDLNMSLPGISGNGQSILVLMEDYLNLQNAIGFPVHGIIGYELFSRFIVEINYSSKIVTFHEPAHFKPKRSYDHLAIQVEDTKPYLMTSLKIGDEPSIVGKFLIDTGASHAVVIHQHSDERFYLPEKNIESNLGKGLTGEIRGHLTRIKSFDIGKYELTDVIASYPDKETYSDSLMSVERNGTIGGEMLSKFNLTFDYMNKRVYLKRNIRFRRTFGYNMSGLELTTSGRELEHVFVAKVRKGSPGDLAGVLAGDKILAANGRVGKDLTIKFLYALFNLRDGKRVKLTIERQGEELTSEFHLIQEI